MDITKLKPANRIKSRFPKEKKRILEIANEIADVINSEATYNEKDVTNDGELIINMGLFSIIVNEEVTDDDSIRVAFLLSVGATTVAVVMKTLIVYFRSYEIIVEMGYDYIYDDDGNLIDVVYEEDMIDEELKKELEESEDSEDK